MPSEAHSMKASEISSNTSHLDNHKELISKESELMKAVTNENENSSFHERGETSRGICLASEVQPMQKQKDVIDLLETNINLIQSRGPNAASGGRGFKYSDFLQHYSVNTKIMLQCPVCEENYLLNKIRKHILSHGGKQTVCRKCRITFPRWVNLYQHYLSYHNFVKPFECSLCPSSFKFKSKILQHLRCDHGIKYKCPKCELKFESLKDHNTRTCMQISQSGSHSAMEITTNISDLRHHEELTTEKSHLSDPISAASRTITDKYNFQERGKVLTERHNATEEQSQLKSKDLPMEVIAEDKGTQNDASVHDRGEMPTEILLPVEVQQQRKGTHSSMLDLVETQLNQNESQSQKKYTSVARGENISEYYSKYYSLNTKIILECPICCEMCTPYSIKKHLKSHGGTKPVCIVCRKLHRHHGLLHEHYLTSHSSVKPFECLICEKSFKLKRHVLNHLRNVHDIRYGTPRYNKDLDSRMDYYAKPHNNAMSLPAIIYEYFSNFERQKKRYDMISKIEENMRNVFGSRCSEKSEVSIPLEFGSPCGVPMSFKYREEKGEQSWLYSGNLSSNTNPMTVSNPVLEKVLVPSDCNTDDAYAYMEELQYNNFATVNKLRTDNLYSTDIFNCLNSDNRLDMEELAVQNSTCDVQYFGILGAFKEEYAVALEQEAYFVSLWMSETDITDAS